VLARSEQGGDGERTARRVTGQGKMTGLDALVEQPLIGRNGIIDLRRMDMLRGSAVVQNQGTAPDRLRQMAVDLAMRVHRRRDVAATTHAQQNPVLGTSFRNRPQRRYAARIRLELSTPPGSAVTSPQCSNISRSSSSGISGLAASAVAQLR
jgi:hypothetical protein